MGVVIKCIIGSLCAFFLMFLFFQANAVVKIGDNIQWQINRLAELEGYTKRWTDYVDADINATPRNDVTDLDLADASTNGAVFTDIDIVDGVVTITLNTSLDSSASNSKQIRLTPVFADTNTDAINDDVIDWVCETDIVTMSKWGNNYALLSYLDWPLSECVHDFAF